MGHKPGFRQMTIYLEPTLYERAKYAAATVHEDLYVFAGKAIEEAIDRRLSKSQRQAVTLMAKTATRNGASRDKRR